MIKAAKEYVSSNLSVYEFFAERSKDFSELSAIKFFGITIKYKTLLEKIDEVERALRAHGVKRGDVIATSLPGVPEAVYLIYAINKIGAKYCAFDCRCQEPEIRDTIAKFKPKLCFVPDFQMKECKNIHDSNLVFVDPAYTVGTVRKITKVIPDFFTGRIAIKAKHKNFTTYDSFIKKATEHESMPPEKNEDNVFGYFYTSGTTYGRKSIILTNDNINSSILQSYDTTSCVKKGDTMMNVMPLFTCYGWTLGTHLPLCYGVNVSLIPIVKPKNLKKYLLREKPAFLITVPAHWEFFVKEKFDGCDLSFLKKVIVGGDKIAPKYEAKINEIFKNGGSSAILCPSWGLSESTSTGASSEIDTPKSSVGKPMSFTTLGIFDKDTFEDLGFGQKGEICIKGPSICQGYYEDEEMTARLLKKHPDGDVWLHSGDIGYLDEDGNLFFCERMKRMYVRYDGTKISPYSIENVILQHPDVNQCLVVPVDDKQHSHGMCAKAMIVLANGVDPAVAKGKLQHYMQENLGQHMIPQSVEFLDKLPYTKNGKLDYFSKSYNEEK